MLDNHDNRSNHNTMLFRNLHPVEDGAVYRSGKIPLDEFKKAVDRLKIRTLLRVVCLQRNNREYFREVERICVERGIRCVSESLTHNRIPDKDILRSIIGSFEDSDYPMLIMCWRGADRSGLTSALYKMYRNRPYSEVTRQLSFYPYGHFRFLHPGYHVFIRELFRRFGGDLHRYLDSDIDLSSTENVME